MARDATRSVPIEVVIAVLGARHLLLLVLVAQRRDVLFEDAVHDVRSLRFGLLSMMVVVEILKINYFRAPRDSK